MVDVFGLILFIGLGWLICRYYWLRVSFCGLLLLITGIAAVAMPVIVVGVSYSEGTYWAIPIQIGFGVIFCGIWLVPAKAAKRWVERQNEIFGGFWKPLRTR